MRSRVRLRGGTAKDCIATISRRLPAPVRKGLYEINYKLYYFGSNNFLKVGWIEENGYVGYANADGELTRAKRR